LTSPLEELLYGTVLPVLVGVSIISNVTICLVLSFIKTDDGKSSSLALDRVSEMLIPILLIYKELILQRII